MKLAQLESSNAREVTDFDLNLHQIGIRSVGSDHC
jgi:hypothetical protein